MTAQGRSGGSLEPRRLMHEERTSPEQFGRSQSDPERTLTGKREGPPDETCVSLSEVVSVASSGVRYAAIWSEPYWRG